MAMILPERTVDAWTAAYITGRRWRARLWSPTERKPGERYDLGVGLGNVAGLPAPPDPKAWPDKVFVLEHKGVGESASGGARFITIRVGQLLDHLEEDRARGGNLVYYLLPSPEWRGRRPAPYGTVPDVAVRRTRGPRLSHGTGFAWDGFQRWAYVVHVEDLRRLLCSIFVAEPNRFSLGSTSGGPDSACRLSLSDLQALRNRVTLCDFVSGVRECTHGRPAGERALRTPPSAPGSLSSRMHGSRADVGVALRAVEVGAAQRVAPDAEGDQFDLELHGEPPGEGDSSDADAFERPSFTTFYGIGDAVQVDG